MFKLVFMLHRQALIIAIIQVRMRRRFLYYKLLSIYLLQSSSLTKRHGTVGTRMQLENISKKSMYYRPKQCYK